MKAPVRIVVVPNGWVFIGTLDTTAPPHVLRLLNASCIRKWGTTRGLGQLALSGPTTETQLDPCGTMETLLAPTLFQLLVDETKWP